MDKKKRTRALIVFGVILILLLVGIFLTGGEGEEESIKNVMKDAVLHEHFVVNFLGMIVNPGFISAMVVTVIFLIFGLYVKFIAAPKFTKIPGRLQLLLEQAVTMFDSLAKSNSPHRNSFLGAYVFTAGAYIFVGTLLELFGIQVITVAGTSTSLPAPLADINGAIAMAIMSYGVIMSGGIASNGFKGILLTLKEFSLPISMSFRLFGALLSGALVTELVYYYLSISFVLPVFVAVMFTLLHALIQAYVLTMLVSLFYGEVSEKSEPKEPKNKKKKLHADAKA